jgi:hypothetical protein
LIFSIPYYPFNGFRGLFWLSGALIYLYSALQACHAVAHNNRWMKALQTTCNGLTYITIVPLSLSVVKGKVTFFVSLVT